MAETFPISCISCRRKKIKCNKLWPCDQCQRRYVHCEFPSTFRNIKINEDSLKLTKSQGSNQKDELETLRIKNNQLLQEKNHLAEQNRKLMEEIEKQGNEPLIESNRKFLLSLLGEDSAKIKKSSVPISGETTEVGERFYGPQTSHYMMDKLRAYKEESVDKDTGVKKKKKTKPSSLPYEGVFIEKFNHYNSDLQKELNLMKKPLPILLRVDPNITDIEHDKKSKKLNIDTIKYLVKLFFKRWSHCSSFIDVNEIFSFLDNFDAIKDDEWEHDDDLLLLYMILIISIHNLMPNEFYYLNFLCGKSMDEFEDVKRKLIYELIYSNFEKLRHNLIFESITTIQAYILCTTWYFIEQKFEECWSMMFHTCSIAYAIGLHVMSTYRLNENPNEEEERDALRYKIWFALKHVSGQICSILGRPNPISIQVNLSVLKSTHNSSSIDLTKRRTHILLKIGSSECLRLSNLMLIENFLMDFTMTDLLNLDQKFDEEIETLEWFLREEGNNLERRRDAAIVEPPLTMERKEIIMDLAILFINKAKLFEPFLTKFDQIKDTTLILQKLTDSITKFLNYIIAFCDIFVTQNQGAAEYDIIISCKLFRHQFPFFNSFIYQGIIVIYTLLHYKADVFSESVTKTDSDFLKSLEEKLKNVLFVDRKLIGNDKLSLKMWSTNTIYLINRVLQQIRIIFERQQNASQEVRFPYGQVPSTNSVESASEDFFGFHMNDPFWLTDPEKLPYFLTSPFGSTSSTNRVDNSANIKPGKESPDQKNFQGLGIPQQPDLMSYSSFFEPPLPVQDPQFPVNLTERMESDPYYFVSSSELSNNASAESENSKSILKEENT